eukprot:Hpha_TRINITY_DN28414_c0_g1::TRINITY_DN28414_c0_g1_i1::g.183925::m.183925
MVSPSRRDVAAAICLPPDDGEVEEESFSPEHRASDPRAGEDMTALPADPGALILQRSHGAPGPSEQGGVEGGSEDEPPSPECRAPGLEGECGGTEGGNGSERGINFASEVPGNPG